MHTMRKLLAVIFIPLFVLCQEGTSKILNRSDQFRSSSTSISNEELRSWNWKCLTCNVGASFMKVAYFASQSQDCLAAIVAKVCTVFNIENSQVCRAISTQYKDEVLYVVGELLLNPSQFCGFMLQNCSEAYNPLHNNWTVPLPEKIEGKKNDASLFRRRLFTLRRLQSPLRVLHLSDIHFDPLYTVGSESDCSYPLCCRDRSSENGPVKKPAGKWGSEGCCDTPLILLENLFQHLKDNETFDYIIWTGDIPPHDVWNQTRTDQLEAYDLLVKMLVKYFPKKMVFSAVGNHESAPADSFPPHFDFLPRKYSISWLYDALADHWTRWVPKSNRKIIRNKASYSVVLFPGLRLIAINTNYCMETNFWLYLNDTDPDQDLAWLVEQLYDAEKAGDKVHIIGHAPSGDSSCLPQWSYNYYRIVNRFSNTILAQFFGHTHADQFAVFYENGDLRKSATNIMYIAPSVTPYDTYMPAYRIYTIDRTTWTVMDHETYSVNLTQANLRDNVEWKFEYKATEAYGLADLSPKSWSQLIERLLKNETLARTFLRHFYRSDDVACDRNCFLDILCQLRSGRSHHRELCSDLPQPQRNVTIAKHRKGIKSIFPIPFVPKECQPKKWISVTNKTKIPNLNANCEIIRNECKSDQCGQICQGIVDEHSIFGEPGKLEQCREAVCHISAACCCPH